MISVHAGTDTYGAVRSVNRTPIVTKFAMLQSLPMFPIESYYQGRLCKPTGTFIPFVGGITERAIIGIPCRRLNRLSVAVAYVRALGATLTVVGAIGVFAFAVSIFSDINFRFNREYGVFATIVGGILAGGLLIALPTYLFTVIVPERDRHIRQSCARLLGLAADPAHVKLDAASEIAASAESYIKAHGIPELNVILNHPKGHGLHELDAWLVYTRAQIQTSHKPDFCEMVTDQILRALDAIEKSEDSENATSLISKAANKTPR